MGGRQTLTPSSRADGCRRVGLTVRQKAKRAAVPVADLEAIDHVLSRRHLGEHGVSPVVHVPTSRSAPGRNMSIRDGRGP